MNAKIRVSALLASVALAAGCAGGGSQQTAMPPSTGRAVSASVTSTGPVAAFFNDQRVSIFIIPLSPSAAQQVLAHNKNVNLIFEATGFLPVINEIQGPGFNPLWQVVDITFKPGITPHQFTSQAAILAAQTSGQITLTFTTMVDSVPVVGPAGK